MIHTSKDAQATAAICSCVPNPWKSKLREATVGLMFAELCFALFYSSTQVRNPL